MSKRRKSKVKEPVYPDAGATGYPEADDLPSMAVPEPPEKRKAKRKLRQLCRQVEIRLSIVLAGSVDDPLLMGLCVSSVDPLPDGRSFLVRVLVPPEHPTRDRESIQERLKAATPLLRSEVAAAIHRKRTPLLEFIVEAGSPGGLELDGEHDL